MNCLQPLRVTLLWLVGLAAHSSASAQIYTEFGCDFAAWDEPFPADYDQHVQPVFDRHCVSCHQPGGEGFIATGLDLRRGHAHESMYRKPSAQIDGWTLLDPYFLNRGRNLMFWKIGCNRPPTGVRMPKGGPPLSGADLYVINSRIARGAPRGIDDGPHLPIQHGLGGSWWDTSAQGQGFSFEVVPGEQPLFIAYWLTFQSTAVREAQNASGLSDLIGPQHELRWLMATGIFEAGDSQVQLDVQLVTGTEFDRPFNPTGRPRSIGSARLRFHSCTEATLGYDIRFDDKEEFGSSAASPCSD